MAKCLSEKKTKREGGKGILEREQCGGERRTKGFGDRLSISWPNNLRSTSNFEGLFYSK